MIRFLSSLGARPQQGILLFIVLLSGALLLARSNTTGHWATAQVLCDNTMMTEVQLAAHRGLSVETLHLLHVQRGLTNENICVLPDDKLARAVNRANHPKPDHPDDALAFRLLQQRDENGIIPPDGLTRAAEQIRLMREAGPSSDRAGISPDSWTWLGPGNIGGRVRSIVIHPFEPNRMWAGSVSGGIWKTTDGGDSWQPVDDFMANLAVSTLAIQPGNPDILYAGTGEGFYNADGIQGAGVFKSIDGGDTWNHLAATAGPNWYYVNRLAISPNGSVILAATRTGIWRSTDGGVNWMWTFENDVFDLNFHPSNNNKAIASGWGVAWYSNDGGLTWSMAEGMPVEGRIEIAYAPSNPSRVYASVNQNSGEIWSSRNGGQSYSLVSTGYNYLGGQGWYDNIIWVDPTNANKLIVGGIDLWRSTNGGAALTQISQWWLAPFSAHADQHVIVEHPGFNGRRNRTVYFGNDGGVYRADNVNTVIGTHGWQELNNNLGITQFYGAAGNPSSGVIVGGTQDNGTLLYTGDTETWTTMFGGDGGFSAADPHDPNVFYGEYIYLWLHRSDNAGSQAEYINGFYNYWNGSSWEERWKPAPYLIPDSQIWNANFIAPFILDPNNPDRLLAGGASLWRTNDPKTPNTETTGPSWASIKPPAESYISAISIAPGNSDIVWVGHNVGEIYKTMNGTAASPTWVRIDSDSSPLPNRYLTRLTIDPRDHNRVYATFGGFTPDNVWYTTDGGGSWSDRTGSGLTGLPDAPVRSLVIHPDNSNWIYAGTEVGIFASEDRGATWLLPQEGPANVSVDELFWMNQTLIAATYGRGLFQVQVQAVPPAAAKLISPSGAIEENPPTFQWVKTDRATRYFLWVNGPAGNVIKQWYEASAVCQTNCSVTPDTALAGGDHTWWVQTWNEAGYGPWSEAMKFQLPVIHPPGPATLISPSGPISDDTPTYQWNAVNDSTWYYLWVNGPSGNLIKQWYEASAVCSAGTCSIKPPSTLAGGSYSWWIRTWNKGGAGPWSGRMDFSLP